MNQEPKAGRRPASQEEAFLLAYFPEEAAILLEDAAPESSETPAEDSELTRVPSSPAR